VKGAHLVTHGLSKHPLYGRWRGMIQRCSDANHKNFSLYGGRGITVCERWKSFPNFLEDMGMPPPGHSLDRKDSSKGYAPENCVWASQPEQMRHTSQTRLVSYDGQTKCLKDWADEIGIHYVTLKYRLANWPIDKAMSHQKYIRNGKAA
jgi:hypothetical protein